MMMMYNIIIIMTVTYTHTEKLYIAIHNTDPIKFTKCKVETSVTFFKFTGVVPKTHFTLHI